MSKGENMVERCAAVVKAKLFETRHRTDTVTFEEIARAVLAELSEPTPAMLLACWQNHHPWGKFAPPPEDRPGMFKVMADEVTADWQAMLRTALSQPNEEGEGK